MHTIGRCSDSTRVTRSRWGGDQRCPTLHWRSLTVLWGHLHCPACTTATAQFARCTVAGDGLPGRRSGHCAATRPPAAVGRHRCCQGRRCASGSWGGVSCRLPAWLKCCPLRSAHTPTATGALRRRLQQRKDGSSEREQQAASEAAAAASHKLRPTTPDPKEQVGGCGCVRGGCWPCAAWRVGDKA
jgi:hypothetical protein